MNNKRIAAKFISLLRIYVIDDQQHHTAGKRASGQAGKRASGQAGKRASGQAGKRASGQ
ncbi:hypothetical protein [Pseudoalteromonas luteoviolacea]|uniref:hypothetical protein n=1 Tax=Pseudoalteromonas luteoviolacea TaxID=43657 RepID=UPI001B3935E5|nr:hypothetical protein [Pseudoalteromonas luteoviolacea]MBQ4835399.1 hypothetical protein [Pseudoalteromonas luteoviolacea]